MVLGADERILNHFTVLEVLCGPSSLRPAYAGKPLKREGPRIGERRNAAAGILHRRKRDIGD